MAYLFSNVPCSLCSFVPSLAETIVMRTRSTARSEPVPPTASDVPTTAASRPPGTVTETTVSQSQSHGSFLFSRTVRSMRSTPLPDKPKLTPFQLNQGWHEKPNGFLGFLFFSNPGLKLIFEQKIQKAKKTRICWFFPTLV